MTAEEIRQRLDQETLEELAALAEEGRDMKGELNGAIGSLAEAYGEDWMKVVESAPQASETAERLLRALALREEERRHRLDDGFPVLHDAVAGDLHAASSASAHLDASAYLSDPLLAGALHRDEAGTQVMKGIEDGVLVSAALAVAIRSVLDDHGDGNAMELARLKGLMGDSGDVIADDWRARLMKTLPAMAAAARSAGADGSCARAKACAESVTQTGRALQGRLPSETVFALGAAALESASDRTKPRLRLTREMRFGHAALATAHGFTAGPFGRLRLGQRDRLLPAGPLAPFDRFDGAVRFDFVAFGLLPLRFVWDELAPLIPLAIDEACRRLECDALSPRCPEGRARRYLVLAKAARESSSDLPEATSFGRILGILESAPEIGTLTDGSRLYRAVPVGRWPAETVVRGRGNREMRLHAVANDAGELVGYSGLDPLSEEFHGMPERYVYDLDGWRKGRLVDGIFRKGSPPVKMMTAPEGIDVDFLHQKKPA